MFSSAANVIAAPLHLLRDRLAHERAEEPETPVWTLSEPRIGVALGGGSARGLSHIPYIEAMGEMGLRPAIIAGTSIGAMIGAGWANGMEGREIREHTLEGLGTLRVIASRLWGSAAGNLLSMVQNGLSGQLDANRVVGNFLPEGFPVEFKDLKVPLYVIATDYHSWHQVVFNTGPIKPAIAGSIAIPTVFRPVPYANHLLIDGGVVNPLPLDQVSGACDIVIGIDVNGDPSGDLQKPDPRVLDVWFGAAQIMMHSLTAHMMAAYPPDIYVRPHVHPFGAHEYWRAREIIEHVDKEKDTFKRQVACKVEAFIADQQRTRATATATGLRRAR